MSKNKKIVLPKRQFKIDVEEALLLMAGIRSADAAEFHGDDHYKALSIERAGKEQGLSDDVIDGLIEGLLGTNDMMVFRLYRRLKVITGGQEPFDTDLPF